MTLIPQERIEAICAMPREVVCDGAKKWLRVPGRTYEDLIQHPMWIPVAAGIAGADIDLLRKMAERFCDQKQREDFERVVAERISPPVRTRP